jgi:hypothetical protein
MFTLAQENPVLRPSSSAAAEEALFIKAPPVYERGTQSYLEATPEAAANLSRAVRIGVANFTTRDSLPPTFRLAGARQVASLGA